MHAMNIRIDTSFLSACFVFQNMLGLSEYAPAFRMHITYIKEGKEQGKKHFYYYLFI
jgi:hypothetical protein